MKYFLTLWILAVSASIYAQEKQIPASQLADPTALYSSIDLRSGLYFRSESYTPTAYDLAGWELNLKADFLILENLRLSLALPMSNRNVNLSFYDNLSLDIGYQIHENNGLFKSSLIELGVTSPVSDDGLIQTSGKSWELRGAYTASLRPARNWGFYPSIQVYRKTLSNLINGRVGSPSSGYPPDVFDPHFIKSLTRTGIRTAIHGSHEFSNKSFLQFGMGYEGGRWSAVSEYQGDAEFFESIVENSYRVDFKQQFSIANKHQLYLSWSGYWRNYNYDGGRQIQVVSSLLSIGYVFLI